MISTVDGYADILWADVTTNLDAMTEQVTQFQAQCRKLPKALREWDAYVDLRKKIDEFLEMLPFIQALTDQSMRDRHWKALQEIVGVKLNLREDEFKLADLLDANILPHADDIEDLTSGAVKEAQVETKLAQIAEEWEDLNFNFTEFKNKGNVLLEPATTGELIERLEDSQMSLGSMATNRYSAPF